MRRLLILGLVALLSFAALPAAAQDAPGVEVQDQVVLGASVQVDRVVSDGSGWMVIHADNNGSFGEVIGYSHLHAGVNSPVHVSIDTERATPTLYAMLHVDSGEAGVYEFGTVEGADGPVMSAEGGPISPPFNVQLLQAAPQFTDEGFSARVVSGAPGFLAIHRAEEGRPGPIIGFAPFEAGNSNVTVTLDEAATETLFPMLHVDDGEMGVYEFGTVEGADGPIVVNGVMAVMPVATVPSIAVHDQVVVHADNMPEGDMMMGDDMMAPTLYVDAALIDVPGWLVVHSDNEGAPGPVIGYTALSAGTNSNLAIELDAAGLTPVVHPMLHVDDGEMGVYEFGTVEGADAPVMSAAGGPVMVMTNIAPSFRANEQAISEGEIVLASVLSDAPGWMVIHASVDGGPGPVLGYAPVHSGLNRNVRVAIDPSSVEGAAADQVFPMLHYDTGEVGVYEFGTVEGADGPVRVNESVVVGPLSLLSGE